MPIDEKILVVSYSGPEGDPPPKVKAITGEYKRTEPGCFRKEGGGKLHFLGGYWYIVNRLAEDVAWVEGGAKTVPQTEWQTRGEGIFGLSYEDMLITVEHKLIAAPGTGLANQGPGCSEACSQCWLAAKDKIPHEHRGTVEAYEAKITVVRDKANQHTETAKQALNEYAPVVKEKTQEAYTACFDFWTHPDTQDTMKKMVNTTADAIKYCIAGCLAITAGLIEQAVAPTCPGKTSQADEVLENDQAMEASYVKLDSGTPVMVEPTTLPPRALFLGDHPPSSPPPDEESI